MIVRKPYAFLIKNFRKIHIALLALSIYVGYTLFDVNSYVNSVVKRGTYDMFNDPISKHITGWLTLAILLLIIGSVSLLVLLLYKKKPWKIYLVPIVEYLALLFVLSAIKNFFNVNKYSTNIDMADIRLTQDLLFIFILAQVAAIGIYIMRTFGLDMKKFQFNIDKEFLELSEADREEVEIGFNVDKYTFIRGYKRFVRNIKYFYLEHKGICKGIAIFIILFSIFQIWKFFFFTHKVYSMGELYSVDGYTFQVNEVYFTDKDQNGNVITEDNNFIILDLTVTNHSNSRTLNLENFHIYNDSLDYITTKRVYAHEFQDLGTAYESTRKIKKDETQNLIIIFSVDKYVPNKKKKKEINKNHFVLYYQEKSGLLRKIKITLNDVSTIQDVQKLTIGDELTLGLKNNDDVIRFDYADVVKEFDYTIKDCDVTTCSFKEKKIVFSTARAVELEFISDTYEAKDMLNFLKNYGKLNYTDSKGENHVLEFVDPVPEAYYGKTVYLRVPAEVEEAKSIYYDFIIRNKHYHYVLLEEASS